MKRLIVPACIIGACVAMFLLTALVLVLVAQGQETQDFPTCPTTRMPTNCMDCHVMSEGIDSKPTFVLKEAKLDSQFIYPNTRTRIKRDATGKLYGYYRLDSIDAREFAEMAEYVFVKHNLFRLVIDVDSYGGSLFEAWGIVNEMMKWELEGRLIETRCSSKAISGGFFIFASGTPGARFTHPGAYFMWHDIQGFVYFKETTTSQKEDEGKLAREFQDEIHKHLAARCRVSKEQIDQNVHYKEWWLRGKVAVDIGLADGFLTKTEALSAQTVKNSGAWGSRDN